MDTGRDRRYDADMRSWTLVLGAFGCGGGVGTGVVPPLVEYEEDCEAPVTWYLDDDEDGFGVAGETRSACVPPVVGWSLRTGDCDDDDPGVYPGAIELCDGVDQDCDGRVDVDAVDAFRWYPDGDGDGAADTTAVPVRSCEPPGDLLGEDAPVDCDDTDPGIYPGAEDVHCDNIDQDCDGIAQAVARVGPASFDTVAAAVRAAEGEPVSVCPGTHPVADVRIEGNVILSGVGDGVVLDGGGGRVLDVTGDRLRLQDVTLIGGEVDGDGGALRATAGSVSLYRVVVRGGQATGSGGALYLDAVRHVTVQDVRVEGSRAGGSGGAIAIVGERHGRSPNVNLSRITTRDTRAGGSGGALSVVNRARRGSVDLSELDIEDSAADGHGGAVSVRMLGEGHVRLGTESGSGRLRIRDARGSVGGLVGIDIAGRGHVRVFGADLSDGTASTRGGLLDIDVGGRTSLQLERCDLARGRAPGGGLVALGVGEDTVSLDIDDTTFSEGDAARGAALWVHTPLAARTRLHLDEVRVWDSRGGAAVDVEVAPGEDPSLLWEGATSALQRNQGGGLRVSEPTADVRLFRIELGELLDDNTGFDLDLGGTLYDWPADPGVWCKDEVCTVAP